MRKLIMLILVILVIVLVWYKIVPLWSNAPTYNNLSNDSRSIIESAPIESIPHEFIPNSPATSSAIDLNTMIKKGIKTKIGIVKINDVNSAYTISINNRPITEIQAQSPIELSNLFAIKSTQIFLVAYNQGGNQCAIQYQFITINDNGYKLSSLFGNCLPYISAIQNLDKINIKFRSNNEYANDKDFIVYQYTNGIVKQIVKDKSNKYYLQRYASVSAKGIMSIAIKDGCASDGILNYDNACGWGKKYCTMFKALKNPVKDENYKILQDFCN